MPETSARTGRLNMRRRRTSFVLLLLAGALIAFAVLKETGSSAEAGRTPSGSVSGGTSPSPHRSATESPASPSPSASNAANATNIYQGIIGPDLSPKVAGDPAYVYVPNGIPGTVEVIDPQTFKVVRTIKLGYRSFPEHVTPSWNLRWLYVDTSAASELAQIDPRTGKLVRIIHNIEHPYNLYFSPDGSVAVDVAEYYNQLRFYDPVTWKLIKALPLPCNGPDHLDFSGTGTFLMLGCEFDGNVLKVDWKRMKVLDKINVGGLPVDVKLSPDGKYFFVGNQGTGGVSVIDATKMQQVKFLHTGSGAHGMAVSRDTKLLYLTNRLAGTISVISFAQQRVIHTWHVGGSPDMVQISPDGSQLWETNRYGTTVTVVDTSNGHIIKQIQVGADPHGLSYFPQPGTYSLGHNGVYR
ncbi:MAG: beta-propeller fold lactonase family protein [Actinomycetota bacterium]